MMPPSRITGSRAICRQQILALARLHPRRCRPGIGSLQEGMLLPEQPCRTSPRQKQLTGNDRSQAILLDICIRRVSALLFSTLTVGIRPVRA